MDGAGGAPYSINISGAERHDGEQPYTVVVKAYTMPQAKLIAWLWFVWAITAEQGQVSAHNDTPDCAGDPCDGHTVDAVIVDCPEYPCHPGRPFPCDSPNHRGATAGDEPPCACPFNWYWIDDSADVTRLIELGYRIPDIAPEENHW